MKYFIFRNRDRVVTEVVEGTWDDAKARVIQLNKAGAGVSASKTQPTPKANPSAQPKLVDTPTTKDGVYIITLDGEVIESGTAMELLAKAYPDCTIDLV